MIITATAPHSVLECQNAGESVPAVPITFASVIALSVTMMMDPVRTHHALQVGGRGPPDNFVTKKKTRIFRNVLTHLEIVF